MNKLETALLLITAVALTACSGKPDHMGVEVDGAYLPVIDMHLHTGNWEGSPPGFRDRLTGRVPTGFKWTMGPFVDWMLTGDNIVSQLDNSGISAAGVFAVYSPHTTGIASNEFTAGQVQADPSRLFPFGSIRVDNWNNDSAQQLEQFEADLINYNMSGIKIAHGHQQFRMDDPRYYGIYEIAGRLGKPMYLHTGTSPNPGTRTEAPYCDPAYLEEAIRMYPDAIFILGHTGYDSYNKALTYTDSSIRLAAMYPNVYMEPGALGADRAEEVVHDFVRKVKEAGVIDKMIYGSDGPQMPGYMGKHLEAYVNAMKDEGYTTDEMRLVLADNYVRVFGIPPIELNAEPKT